MKRVWLLGNGFDLAHGLRTKYEDFIELLKKWESFYIDYKHNKHIQYRDDNQLSFSELAGLDIESEVERLLRLAIYSDAEKIEQLNKIIKTNSWVQYYCHCGAEIDGWIDFEKEIIPVIELFDFVFHSEHVVVHSNGRMTSAYIDRQHFNQNNLRMAYLWEKYFDTTNGDSICIRYEYVSKQYGILEKKIMNSLQKEFDEFIIAFEIYLLEFVHKQKNVCTLKQIEKIGMDNVISFNYTLTEQLYGIEEMNTHHIHGMIRSELSHGDNNMVLGISDNQRMNYIYFVKYFQRIRKSVGVRYKSFINEFYINEIGKRLRQQYYLYIYGHSLDATDEDLLKFAIGDYSENGVFQLKPQQVIIFFYNMSDYEHKVINLIKLYGRSLVEEYMERELFKFVKISSS